MLDQYSYNLQAIPGLLHGIEPQMPPTHVSAHREAAPTDPTALQPSPAAHATTNTPHVPLEPAQPPYPPPRSKPTADQDYYWRLRLYLLTIPSSSSSSRWQQLIQNSSKLDINSYSCKQNKDFHAGTLVIGGSLRVRITDITFAFAATQLDYLCLQDTRQTKREGLIIVNLIRKLLPSNTPVLKAHIVKARPPDPPPNGGQMTLISARWSHYANTQLLLASSTRCQPTLPLTARPHRPVSPTAQPIPRLSGHGPTSPLTCIQDLIMR
jgi:hypothetical protein